MLSERKIYDYDVDMLFPNDKIKEKFIDNTFSDAGIINLIKECATEKGEAVWVEKMKKYGQDYKQPEERYIQCVVIPFIRVDKKVRQTLNMYNTNNDDKLLSWLSSTKETPYKKMFSQLPNEDMGDLIKDCLSFNSGIAEIFDEVLSDYYTAIEGIYYKAFPLDYQLKEDKEKKIEIKTSEPVIEDRTEIDWNEIVDGLIKILKDEDSKIPTTKVKTYKELINDFINSDKKTRK